MYKRQLLAHVNDLGDFVMGRMRAMQEEHDLIGDVRGMGLMLGIELVRDCGELVERGLEAGLLLNVTAGNTLRLLPPLVIDEQEARTLAAGVLELIRDFA